MFFIIIIIYFAAKFALATGDFFWLWVLVSFVNVLDVIQHSAKRERKDFLLEMESTKT